MAKTVFFEKNRTKTLVKATLLLIVTNLYSYSQENKSSVWEFLGPKKRSGQYWGMGRVSDIAFHPTDENIFYVGAPKGGIWETEDGGRSYRSIGDNLPYNSAGNVVVDQANPNTIHITVGDRVGWWDYGMGVYRSTDGGNTWSATSLNTKLEDRVAYLDMKGSPHIPNLLIVATTAGVYRSTDGISFHLANEGLPKSSKGGWGNALEIAFHTKNPNIAYLAWWDYKGVNTDLFKSEDRGLSWKNVTNFDFEENGKLNVAVTPANPNKVVVQTVIGDEKKIHYSLDNGETWVSNDRIDHLKKSRIFVSPKNEDIIYSGYGRIKRSLDNGKTFENLTTQKGEDYVHLDQWVTVYNPLNDKIYWGNDGGVYEYSESTGKWKELNDGLCITQVYRTFVAQSAENTYFFGSQDNGGGFYSPETGLINGNGGDAVSNAIDPQNAKVGFSTFPSGKELYRTMDGWKTKKRIEKNIPGYKGKADWVSPFDLSWQLSGKIIVASKEIFLSYNYGDTWEKIADKNISADEKIRDIRFTKNDDRSIYAITKSSILESSNGGRSWSRYDFDSKKLKRLEPHPSKRDQLWIIDEGYNEGRKVFFSKNRGKSFENISENLPNIPVLSIVYDEVSNKLFLGTELGLYSSDSDKIYWEKVGGGLPNTRVMDIDIHYKTRKLYVSTYGRGVWRFDMGRL